MTFVWPYINGPSWWNKTGTFYELKHSVATVKKLFPDARCLVVGDKPQFEVEHIPVERIETWSHCDARHADIIKKLSVVADLVDGFILMYDDIFLLDVTKKDLKTFYALCEIPDLEQYSRKGGLLYTRLWRNTYKEVSKISANLVDWETHLPRFFESERLKWVVKEYDLLHNDLLLTSLYPAIFAEEYVLLNENEQIRAYIDQMGPSVDLDKEFKKKILVIDDNAVTPSMIDRIEGLTN